MDPNGGPNTSSARCGDYTACVDPKIDIRGDGDGVGMHFTAVQSSESRVRTGVVVGVMRHIKRVLSVKC